MQRRAAAAYVAVFVVIAVGAYAITAVATPPAPSFGVDHELEQGDTVTLGGTTYEVTELSTGAGGDGPSATIEHEANGSTESVEVTEGENVTLGGTTYAVHFSGGTVQLTSDRSGYQQYAERVEAFEGQIRGLSAVAALSGIAAVVLLAAAYMPVKR